MTTPCPEYAWCEQDHTDKRSMDDFHMKFDPREPDVAVLRADLVLDQGVASIDFSDNLMWTVPTAQVPAFLQEMRAELDRIEKLANAFIASTTPLKRRTEPGEPVLDGIGGGL